eukprot:1637686-Rhodomonas_salina.1
MSGTDGDYQPTVKALAEGCESDVALDAMAREVGAELKRMATRLGSVWVEAQAVVDIGCDALSRDKSIDER